MIIIRIVLGILAVFSGISVVGVICAFMLSSQISQMEERMGVYKDYDEDN